MKILKAKKGSLSAGKMIGLFIALIIVSALIGTDFLKRSKRLEKYFHNNHHRNLWKFQRCESYTLELVTFRNGFGNISLKQNDFWSSEFSPLRSCSSWLQDERVGVTL